jgi:gliding motility-associated lipoprotein GldD
MNKIRWATICLLFVGIYACTEEFTPKPRGYFRIDFPEKEYARLNGTAPYAFDIASNASVKLKEGFWMDINYPQYKAQIHLTYKPIDVNLLKLLEETRSLAYTHAQKAEGIAENVFENPASRSYGILYEIEGNAASGIQFFVTDSTHHFLRGALYFLSSPNADSLLPVQQYLLEDVVHLIETVQWAE